MSKNQWNPELYDSHLYFVSQYGEAVLELLHTESEEVVLDLGCFTGDLSKEISKACKEVIGLDLSNQMLEQAREKYPEIQFIHASGAAIPYKNYFDSVFSNATLHWIKNAEEVVYSVSKALKPKGRFVAELGGHGNIKKLLLRLIRCWIVSSILVVGKGVLGTFQQLVNTQRFWKNTILKYNLFNFLIVQHF